MSNNFAEHQTLSLNIKLLSITRNISMFRESLSHSFLSYAILQLIPKPSFLFAHLFDILVFFCGDGRQGYLAETTKNTNRKWNNDLLGA